MAEVDEQLWRRVGSLDPPAEGSDPIAVADRGAPGTSRFRSASGHRAVLLPPSPEGTELLFIDPPSADVALSLLNALGERSRSVLVALPEGTDPVGLVPERAQVSLTVGREKVLYALFRVVLSAHADRDRLAAGPKLAEGEDALDRRSDWFGSRGGGPDRA